MSDQILHFNSISHLHSTLGLEAPKHPLISVLDAAELTVPEHGVGVKCTYDFFMISLKDKSCGMEYGRNAFDFEEGVMIFTAPGQIYTPTRIIEKGEISGWLLYFHPDLIRHSALGTEIDKHSFFNYDVYEALHLSAEEEQTVHATVKNIEAEYQQRIDNHSQRVIVSNLELLLTYCQRFYERQFNTRTNQGRDIVSHFEKSLKEYFKAGLHVENGLPSIQYFAEKAHLSAHYFSDLLKKETGRRPKDHINDYVVEKAKSLLLATEQSISEIAYDLGFNYPHYFTRLFKSKTGQTPVQYRNNA